VNRTSYTIEEIGMQNSRQAYVNLALATAAFAVAFAALRTISPPLASDPSRVQAGQYVDRLVDRGEPAIKIPSK
jgi:hypothetical protein